MKKIVIIGLVLMVGLGIAFTSFAKGPTSLFRRIDFINIGDSVSEAAHNLKGWGPVEPITNGGNWGEIGNDMSGSDCDLPEGQSCDGACRVTYNGTEQDHPSERAAYLTFKLKSKHGLIRGLRIRALEGIANDDFMVFVKNRKGNWILAYTYESDLSSTEEVWKVHNIKLHPRDWFHLGKPLEVSIMATGDTWNSHDTYGQLGIDWVELIGWKGITPPIEIHPLDF